MQLPSGPHRAAPRPPARATGRPPSVRRPADEPDAPETGVFESEYQIVLSSIGTAASSLTSNQIVAFLIAVSLCIVPYVVGFFLAAVPPSILPVVQYLSFDYHFSGMSRGVIDTRNLVFTLSICALFLHVAVFSLEQRRLS